MRKIVCKGLTFLLLMVMLVGCGSAGENTEPETEKNSQVATEKESEILTESEVPEPVVSTVTITATGDCALGALQYHGYDSSFHAFYDAYGEEYFFKNFKAIFESDDLTLINLECVFTDAADRVEKELASKGNLVTMEFCPLVRSKLLRWETIIHRTMVHKAWKTPRSRWMKLV